jgi:hypothetical protein
MSTINTTKMENYLEIFYELKYKTRLIKEWRKYFSPESKNFELLLITYLFSV